MSVQSKAVKWLVTLALVVTLACLSFWNLDQAAKIASVLAAAGAHRQANLSGESPLEVRLGKAVKGVSGRMFPT